jgi:hypothetical protein
MIKEINQLIKQLEGEREKCPELHEEITELIEGLENWKATSILYGFNTQENEHGYYKENKLNVLEPGVKVRMKDGEILTVKSLELREFVSKEKIGYISKWDIDTIIG